MCIFARMADDKSRNCSTCSIRSQSFLSSFTAKRIANEPKKRMGPVASSGENVNE
jgi:hypothetical protein